MHFNNKKKKQINLQPLFTIIILIVGFFFFKWVFGLFSGSGEIQQSLNINYAGFTEDKIEFAGSEINFKRKDREHIRTNLEKEILITLYSQYQLILRIKRTSIYFPTIEKKLAEANLPDDLKYISVAESYLKNDAVSSASAKGLWQFMPGTAIQYGLVVNDYVDERMNYEKATDSAIKYLSFINNKFNGDWKLAMAGYNMGENGLNSRMNDQGESDYFKLRLNDETSRYVYRVIAMKYVYENQKKLGIEIPKEAHYKEVETENVSIREITDIKKFTSDYGTTIYEFYKANPWILGKDNILPPREDEAQWIVKVPKK
ncbi:MAG: lytic transglycosylase domain-containing protein [Candidatus Absconditabacteria bacterium]